MRRSSPHLQTNWDWRAAGNFICGGTGCGLLFMGGVSTMYGPVPLVPVIGVALGLTAAGLTLVWLEIGRPWRFIHVFFNPRTSWMTRESLIAVPLFGLGGLAAWLDGPWLCLAAGAVGLGFLYCQSRILTAAKGIPAWREPLIAPLIIITGLTEGAGLLLFAVTQIPDHYPWFLWILVILLVVRLVVWLMYRARIEAHGAPAITLRVLADINRWFLPLGFALPVIALITALAMGSQAHWVGVASGVLAAASGWLMKYKLITEAAHTQGFALPLSPVRGQGSAGPDVTPGWN